MLKSFGIDVERLLAAAKAVLDGNRSDGFTRPGPDHYPHQWFWDSCKHVMGLVHYDIERAKTELRSLLRGQWRNGMIPNMIFAPTAKGRRPIDARLWGAHRSPHAPRDRYTSGITQPPLLAEAVVRVLDKLPEGDRQEFAVEMYPAVLAYHQWLYRERARPDGLVVLVHPWECGFDNTPPWTTTLHRAAPWYLRWLDRAGWMDRLVDLFRRDTRHSPVDERLSAADTVRYFWLQRRLRRWRYDSATILKRSPVQVVDLPFNAILVRANTLLGQLAETAGQTLPSELAQQMAQTAGALELCWHEGAYYSLDGRTGRPILEPTIATFLPLYAGTISPERARQLVTLLNQPEYATAWPIPTVPTNSPFYKERGYWQGPVWVNIVCLIICGLYRHGFKAEADRLLVKLLQMIADNGIHEYFSAKDGRGAGAKNFSWTASLVIDLILRHAAYA